MKFHPVKKTDALPSCLKLRMLALDGTVQWRFFFRLTIHHSTDCSLKSSNAPLTCRPDGSHLVSKPWVHIFLYWYNRQRWKRDAVWISFLICCRSDLFEVPCIWKSFFFASLWYNNLVFWRICPTLMTVSSCITATFWYNTFKNIILDFIVRK